MACRWKAQKGMGTSEGMKISQKQTKPPLPWFACSPPPSTYLFFKLGFLFVLFPNRILKVFLILPNPFSLSEHFSISHKKNYTRRKLLTSFYTKKKTKTPHSPIPFKSIPIKELLPTASPSPCPDLPWLRGTYLLSASIRSLQPSNLSSWHGMAPRAWGELRAVQGWRQLSLSQAHVSAQVFEGVGVMGSTGTWTRHSSTADVDTQRSKSPPSAPHAHHPFDTSLPLTRTQNHTSATTSLTSTHPHGEIPR